MKWYEMTVYLWHLIPVIRWDRHNIKHKLLSGQFAKCTRHSNMSVYYNISRNAPWVLVWHRRNILVVQDENCGWWYIRLEKTKQNSWIEYPYHPFVCEMDSPISHFRFPCSIYHSGFYSRALGLWSRERATRRYPCSGEDQNTFGLDCCHPD